MAITQHFMVAFWILLFSSLTATFASAEPPDDTFTCPNADVISPCTCNATIKFINCEGRSVTQKTLNKTFATLRTVNNIPFPLTLTLSNFRLYSTCIPSLDLTPFLACRFTVSFDLNTNSLITKIVGPPLTKLRVNGSDIRVDTPSFSIFDYRQLADKGFGNTLRYFVPESMVTLGLYEMPIRGMQNPIDDNEGDVEFLPGMGSLVNLQSFSFCYNRATVSLAGGQFKRNSKLVNIDLYGLENLGKLGEDALLIDRDESLGDDVVRTIRIFTNKLHDSSFQRHSGLESFTKPTYIWMGQSHFDFLSRKNFEGYLRANEKNVLNFNVQTFSDAFVCDKKMKWLKDKREEYESRVFAVYCSNDPKPWTSVFETKLIQ